MQEILFLSTLLALVLGTALFIALRRLVFPQAVPAPGADWIERFSVNRYRPMERLLDERDFAFLASCRGCGPALVRKLRAERRRVFRGYLTCLRRDFNRICGILERQLVHSAHDRPDLAAALLKQRAAFALGMLGVEGRLWLHACGWGTVDVQKLLGALESLRLATRQLAASGAIA